MADDSKRIPALLRLPPERRYRHFIKVIVDREAAWGLRGDDGWALAAADGSDEPVLPLWPDRAVAERFAIDEWRTCEPTAIPLDELKDQFIAHLTEAGIGISIFPSDDDSTVIADVEQFLGHIHDEELNY